MLCSQQARNGSKTGFEPSSKPDLSQRPTNIRFPRRPAVVGVTAGARPPRCWCRAPSTGTPGASKSRWKRSTRRAKRWASSCRRCWWG